eukprot:3140172-Prymnesium_polylepis.2
MRHFRLAPAAEMAGGYSCGAPAAAGAPSRVARPGSARVSRASHRGPRAGLWDVRLGAAEGVTEGQGLRRDRACGAWCMREAR